MGWNSWNLAGCAINETFFRATVESLASKGFLEHGYEYINLVRGAFVQIAGAPPVPPPHARPLALTIRAAAAGRLLDGHRA